MTTEELLRTYFRCLDTEDWPRMRELWHDDGAFVAVGARPRHGIGEVMAFLGKLFAPWAVHEDRPTRLLPSGDTTTVEVTFTGTTHDGRVVAFDAIDVIDVADGRIRRITNWYDIAYARRALAPAGASPR